MSYVNKGSTTTTVIVSREPDRSGNYFCDGVADEVEINLALNYANTLVGGEVVLLEGTYTLAATITFPGNGLVLRGIGRKTIINVPDLTPTTFNGITLTGRDECVIKDLAIQTAAGGGDTVHCIFLEDGSDHFLIENVWIVESDANGIHIEGTDINYGTIHHCHITGCDDDGINADMDAANYLDYLTISDNDIWGNGDDGIEFGYRVRDSLVKLNQINGNTGFGINISDVTSTDNVVENNKLCDDTAGAINDGGTGTVIPYFWEKPPNIDSNIGEHPAQQMLDNVDTYIYDQIYIPPGFQELVTAQIVVVQGTAAAPNTVWTCNTNWGGICVGEDYFEDSDVTGATTAMPQDDLVCLDISAALDGIAANDLVGVSFMRDGNNVADTVGGPVFYLGIRVRYV